MTPTIILPVALLTSALIFTGCTDDRSSDYPNRDRNTNSMTNAAESSSLAKTDLNFLRKAVSGGLFEVRTSTDALRRSNLSPDERAFAQQMVDEHGQVNRELASLAARKNVNVPTGLDKSAAEKAAKLANSDDEGFPERYLECQIDAHQDAISLFEDASTDGKDADVRDFASKTLPHLRAHLEAAKALEDRH